VATSDALTVLPPSSMTIEPIALRAMFWRPECREPSDWHPHVPLGFWLVEAQAPRALVSIGCPDVVAHHAYCQAVEKLGLASRCAAVPAWPAMSNGDDPGAHAAHAALVDRYAGVAEILRGDQEGILDRFSDHEVDLLHVDGTWTFAALQQLLQRWWPKLSRDALLVLHGTEPSHHDNAMHRLLVELGKGRALATFQAGRGAAVIQVGDELRPMPARLASARLSEAGRRSVHEIFARLGRACVDAQRAHESEQRAKSLAAELEAHALRFDDARSALAQAMSRASASERELAEVRARLLARDDEGERYIEQLRESGEALRRQVDDLASRLVTDGQEAERLRARLAEAEQGLAASPSTQTLLAAANGDLSEARRRIAQLEEQRETLMAAHSAELAELRDQQRAATARDAVLLKLKIESEAQARASLQSLTERHGKLEQDTAALAAALRAAQRLQEERLAAVKSESERVNEAVAAAHEAMKASHQSLLADRDAARAELGPVREQVASLTSALEDERSLTAALKEAVTSLQARLDAEAAEQRQIESLEAALATERAAHASALADAKAGHEAALRDAVSARDEATQRAAALEQALAAADAKGSALHERCASLEARQSGAQNLVQRATAALQSARATQAELASERDALSSRLSEAVSSHASAMSDLRGKLDELEARAAAEAVAARRQAAAELSDLRSELEARDAQLGVAQAALENERRERFRETEQLTRMLLDAERRLAEAHAAAESDRQAFAERLDAAERRTAAAASRLAAVTAEREAIVSSRSWRLTAPVRRLTGGRRTTPETRVRTSGLFDADWYLATYPDVAAAGIDPLAHYLEHGASEGRDPGPGFSSRAYLARYPDVAEAGLNPLMHYLEFGRIEGREPQ
jgi:chromosome segregation ATPase